MVDGGEAPPSQSVIQENHAVDDGGPVGPTEAEESSLLAEQEAAGPALNARPSTPGPASPPLDAGDLPLLDDLVQRIPAPTRALIDELFRAKFVAVKRLPRSALKP